MSYFRNPKTTNEKRAWYQLLFDVSEYGPIRARLSRSAVRLVSSYDDINRSTWGYRCWKRFRKTKYREKACTKSDSKHDT